jgi:hypothetical protein
MTPAQKEKPAMRRLGRTARTGTTLFVAVAVAGLAAGASAGAQTEPPPGPVVVIPGGPPFVLSGSFAGVVSSAPGDFQCPQPSQAPVRVDSSGSFTHPTLGEGTYEFHRRHCIPTEGTKPAALLDGAFVLDGSNRFLSGKLWYTKFLEGVPAGFGFEIALQAGGGCTAHFQANGEDVLNTSTGLFDESGSLTQQGSIVCRLTR